MKLNRCGRIAALALAGVFALTACGNNPTTSASAAGADSGSSGGSDLSGTLAAGGASSQQAAMQAWIAGFQQQHPGVTVSYDPIGSGGGVTQFIQGAYPFAGSDAALDDTQAKKAARQCGGEALHLPTYISPIAVAFNLKGVDDLKLSPKTLANIFNGTITKWNDPAIEATNPEADLPNTPIRPVHRSDESGTTENFVDYLHATAPKAWPHQVSGTWPIPGGQSAKGTSGVVQAISSGKGTIGYADASQVGDLSTVKVKVGGEYVAYSAEAAAKVVEVSPQAEGASKHNLKIDLERTTTKSGVYPIVLVSYEIACPQYSDEQTGKLTKAFLSFVASEQGQQMAAKAAGSAPLSPQLRSDVQAAIASIEVGS